MNAERNTYLINRWKTKSQKYPRYSNPSGEVREHVLRSISEIGIDFSGKSVIDIGCGTGIYTICVAKQASQVTGVDISEEMLAILKEDSEAEGCRNIEMINSPWDTFDRKGRKWDIAFSTMSPAMDSASDFQRATDCAREAVVYLGWGGKRENRFVSTVAEKHGLTLRTFHCSEQVRTWLEDKGISYTTKVFDETRIKTIAASEAIEYCIDECSNYRLDVTEDMVEPCMPDFIDENGDITFTITSQLELITWQV